MPLFWIQRVEDRWRAAKGCGLEINPGCCGKVRPEYVRRTLDWVSYRGNLHSIGVVIGASAMEKVDQMHPHFSIEGSILRFFCLCKHSWWTHHHTVRWSFDYFQQLMKTSIKDITHIWTTLWVGSVWTCCRLFATACFGCQSQSVNQFEDTTLFVCFGVLVMLSEMPWDHLSSSPAWLSGLFLAMVTLFSKIICSIEMTAQCEVFLFLDGSHVCSAHLWTAIIPSLSCRVITIHIHTPNMSMIKLFVRRVNLSVLLCSMHQTDAFHFKM